MKFLSLFTGIGGFDLGLEWCGMECIGQVEYEPYNLAILTQHWPDVPKWMDIHDFKGKEYKTVDLVCGGFPCQPFSQAGKRKGRDDNRYLWPEMLRVIKETTPRWVIGENVPGLLSIEGGMVFERVCADLESEGYEVWPFIIPACAVNAKHKRDRVWIVAYSNRNRHQGDERLRKNQSENSRREESPHGATWKCLDDSDSWETSKIFTSRIGGNINGIPNRSHRIKAMGNAVVPQVVEVLGRTIIEFEELKQNKN